MIYTIYVPVNMLIDNSTRKGNAMYSYKKESDFIILKNDNNGKEVFLNNYDESKKFMDELMYMEKELELIQEYDNISDSEFDEMYESKFDIIASKYFNN